MVELGLRNATVHQVDEHVAGEYLLTLTRIYAAHRYVLLIGRLRRT